MKNILILFFTLFFLFSCTNGVKKSELNTQVSEINNDTTLSVEDEWNTNQDLEDNSIMSVNDLLSQIGEQYTSNSSFNSCVATTIDMCIMEQSYNTEIDISCDDYVLEENRENCRDTQILESAKNQGDINLCEWMEDKESCEFEVLLMKWLEEGDASVCEKVAEGFKTQCNNEIVNSVAIKELDEKICENIIPYDDTEFEKQFCRDEVDFFKKEAEMNQLLEQEENWENAS